MTDSQKDKAVKTAYMTYKNNEKTKAETGPLVAGKDLKTTKEELAAAMEYFEKPKPSCVEAGLSYQDRVVTRKARIERWRSWSTPSVRSRTSCCLGSRHGSWGG